MIVYSLEYSQHEMSKIKSTELSALIKWNHSFGVNTDAVSISNYLTTGRGMGVTRQVYTNENVLEIPREVLITGPQVLKSGKLSRILETTGLRYDMQDCFLLWLGFTLITLLYKSALSKL